MIRVIKMSLTEGSAERTMSLMVDRPIPIKGTEYAYYAGELLPFMVALYMWLSYNERYITTNKRIKESHTGLSLERLMIKVGEQRRLLGFYTPSAPLKTDKEITNILVTILEN